MHFHCLRLYFAENGIDIDRQKGTVLKDEGNGIEIGDWDAFIKENNLDIKKPDLEELMEKYKDEKEPLPYKKNSLSVFHSRDIPYLNPGCHAVGNLIFNATEEKIMIWNGTNWQFIK